MSRRECADALPSITCDPLDQQIKKGDVAMSQKPDLVQVVNSMQLPESAARMFTPEIMPIGIPDLKSIAQSFEGLTAAVEGTPVEIRSFSGEVVAQSIQWTCYARNRTQLLYNGVPFRCQELHYSVINISWQAGNGWPVYTTYCPRSDYHTTMKFPNCKVHQIVPEFGGFHWSGCNNPASGRGNYVTEVFFSVNDSDYSDNMGMFTVVVTGWS
jgi:hypothetical protein